MNESRVIALRFRPKKFDQVVGQEAIVRTLTNAIKSGSLHHAYLFAGARGVGKTTTARLLAKALNCVRRPTIEPCGVCDYCVDISRGTSMFVQEIDAASNTGVDNVRQIILNSAMMFQPTGHHNLFIIDEVHQLSGPAFNALLKTIEEPPVGVVFIMATTELQKVPDTILSRCQVFEFKTIPLPKVTAELKRIAGELGITISDSALNAIARAGEGSMRDAESAFDQVISFAGDDVSDEDVSAALGLPSLETLRAVLDAVADQDPQAMLRIVDIIVARGYDLRNFCREVMTYVRNLVIVKVLGFDQELTQMPQSEAQGMALLADRFSDQDLIRFFSILTRTEQDIRVSSQPRFQLEIGLVKIAQLARLYLLEEAIGRMEAIEARLRGEDGSAQPQSAELKANSNPVKDRIAAPPRTARIPARADKPMRAALPVPDASAPKPPHHALAQDSSSSGGATQGQKPENIARSDRSPALPSDTADSGSPIEEQGNPAAAQALARTSGRTAPDKKPSTPIEKVRKVLEGRTPPKIMLSIALERAEHVAIEGSYLLLSYASSNQHEKAQVDSARRLIEEACYEALGARLTLSTSVAGSSHPVQEAPPSTMAQAAAKTDDRAPENHPAVRAIIERFNGEIIDVEAPDR